MTLARLFKLAGRVDTMRSLAQSRGPERKLFPCYFGAAAQTGWASGGPAGKELDGVYSRSQPYPAGFGARVYKIARDPQGTPADLSEGHRRQPPGERRMLAGRDWQGEG